MARILFGWELGAGLGHVATLVPLARALVARGHEVTLALRDPVACWPLLRDSGLRVVAAPLVFPGTTPASRKPFVARSYADILAWHGFDDSAVLSPLLGAWHGLFDLLRPDLIVAEHAPTLCLAAHGRIPTLGVGTGFTVPVLDGAGEFPVFRQEASALVPAARLHEVLGAVLSAHGQPVPSQPLRAVMGDRGMVTTFAEIDPYRPARRTPAVGPVWPVPAAAALPAAPRCLVYLPADHPALEKIARGLRGLSMPGDVYVRGASPRVRAWFEEAGLVVAERPLALAEVLPGATVVLHHGGAGITQHCLAWGRPQVVAPAFLEQQITAEVLRRANLAVLLGGPVQHGMSGEALSFVSASAVARTVATDLAARLRAQYAGGSLPVVVGACESMLNPACPE